MLIILKPFRLILYGFKTMSYVLLLIVEMAKVW
ncbi:hypothetical protein QFZ37_002238 [Chryseobacterium ginsenosidimutans]|nr:hypothetical protein [Chryseobacterium ginsenosidimutans]